MAFPFKLPRIFSSAAKPVDAATPVTPATVIDFPGASSATRATPSPNAPRRTLLSRIAAVRDNLKESIKKDWAWMAASVGVGAGAKILTAAVAPQAAVVMAAGVLSVNMLRYVKERRAEIKDPMTSPMPRSWARAALDESGLFATHLVSKQFWTRNLVSGTISAATFGIISGVEHFDELSQKAAALFNAPATPTTSGVAPLNTAGGTIPSLTPPVAPHVATPLERAKDYVEGVLKPSKSAEAALAAAQSGKSQGIKDLAFFLQNGKGGLPVDKELAHELYKQAAAAGNHQAIADLDWIDGKSAPAPVHHAVPHAGGAHHSALHSAAPLAAEDVAPNAAPVDAPAPLASVPDESTVTPPLSTIDEGTRTAALASVGLPNAPAAHGGNLVAECGPVVAASDDMSYTIMANCRELADVAKDGDYVRHVAPNGVTETFTYASEGEASVATKRFRLDTLKQFVQENLSAFMKPAVH